jgi:hypothetical protein
VIDVRRGHGVAFSGYFVIHAAGLFKKGKQKLVQFGQITPIISPAKGIILATGMLKKLCNNGHLRNVIQSVLCLQSIPVTHDTFNDLFKTTVT